MPPACHGAPGTFLSLQNNRRCSRSQQTIDASAGWWHHRCKRAGRIAARDPRTTSVPSRQSESTHTHTVAPIARLMHRLQPCPAILPKTGRNHPLPQRLARQMNPLQLRQLLCSQRRTEVEIALPDDADDFGAHRCRITAVARSATAAGDQGLRAMLIIGLRQPKYLTSAKPHHHPIQLPDLHVATAE